MSMSLCCSCVCVAYFDEIYRQKYDGDIKRALILFISPFDLYQCPVCCWWFFGVAWVSLAQMWRDGMLNVCLIGAMQE